MIQIPKEQIIAHYSRKEVQEEIYRCSINKEVVGSYGGTGYAKRPDIILHKNDIMELVNQGITSFHMSEETWSNPLSIDPLMKKNETEQLRIGWDLILDIDCKFLEYSKIAAHLLIEALKHHNINSVSVKFSGNHGFHIAVPFEAFPKTINGEELRKMFPEAPRRIAQYLKDMIKEPLGNMILNLEKNDFSNIMKKTEKTAAEITKIEKDSNGQMRQSLNAEPFLEIDTILISSRHLLRQVYSFNEKVGLISIPITAEEILGFNKDLAIAENIKNFSVKFLDRSIAKEGEATALFISAYDYIPKIEQEKYTQKKEYEILDAPIPKELFPPCINKILGGLRDGKKRSLFILVNFLSSCGYNYEDIEKMVVEWNKKNPEPLRDTLILGNVRYHKQQKKLILPPNCISTYYKDLMLCTPDNYCKKIRNPVSYAKNKSKFLEEENKSKKKKKNQDVIG